MKTVKGFLISQIDEFEEEISNHCNNEYNECCVNIIHCIVYATRRIHRYRDKDRGLKMFSMEAIVRANPLVA